MKAIGIFSAVLVFASSAPLASAAMQLAYQVAGVDPAPVVCSYLAPPTATAAVCTSSINDHGVSISFFDGASNSPGGAPFNNANQSSTSVQITNTSTTLTETLNLWVWAPGFTTPTAPPNIFWASNFTGTWLGGSGTIGMTSCADTGYPGTPSTAYCTSGPTLTNTTVPFSGVNTAPQNTVMTNVATLGPPYTLEEDITVVLAPSSQVNVESSQVLTPVPEPMSIALLGGVILLTSGAIRRKRKQEASRV
jgi:hypothetical protein